MKIISAFLFFLVATTAGVSAKLPLIFPEIKLAGGTVIKKVEFVSFARNAAMAKWEGGRGSLKYDALPKDVLDAVKSNIPPPLTEKQLEEEARMAAAQQAIRIEQETKRKPSLVAYPRRISGQVFVTTRGAGAYKFSGAEVIAFPISVFDTIKNNASNNFSSVKAIKTSLWTDEFGKEQFLAWVKAAADQSPLSATVTDAEGGFTISVNSREPVFLFCATYRNTGREAEYNIWAAPIGDADRIDLNSNNHL